MDVLHNPQIGIGGTVYLLHVHVKPLLPVR